MFGNPSVIVTTPEACKRVLTDDDKFTLGWPSSTVELMGKKSFISISYEEHRRLRRLTSASINGYEALSVYLKYIEEAVISALEKWTHMGEIEFLTQMRKLTFKIIVHIFLGSESEEVMEELEKEYTTLNLGVRAMRINLPGFAFHKAFKVTFDHHFTDLLNVQYMKTCMNKMFISVYLPLMGIKCWVVVFIC